ncbi:MAG: hypothetical protein NVSMB29_06820 [Candidatus Dormibacteria bacterium]
MQHPERLRCFKGMTPLLLLLLSLGLLDLLVLLAGADSRKGTDRPSRFRLR